MGLSVQQQDRLRGVAQGLFGLIGGVTSFVKVIGLCVIGVGFAFLVSGLLTADPDTATFRDFLLAVQSPQLHRMVFVTGCTIGVPLWVFAMMARSSRVRYPVAAAAMGRSSLHRSEAEKSSAPKGDGGHD